MPLTYKVTQNQYVVQDDINQNIIYVTLAILVCLIIVMILKFRTKGILGAVSFMGFIALYLLLIRYTNVTISLDSMVAITIISLINYIEVINLLKINEPDEELNKKAFTKEYKQLISKVIPISIISIIFSFATWEALATFGMISFWGIALMMIYNYIITKKVID